MSTLTSFSGGLNISNPLSTGGYYVSSGTSYTYTTSTYLTKEELNKELDLRFAKQILILGRSKFKELGIDTRVLKSMLDGKDEDSIKYALEVIENIEI